MNCAPFLGKEISWREIYRFSRVEKSVLAVITNVNVTFYSRFEMSHFSVHKSSMDGFQVVSTFYF